MPSVRSLVRFIGTALAVFVVLRALAGTGLYPPFFRATASPLCLAFGSHRVAKLAPFAHAKGIYDTKLSLGSDASGTPELVQDVLLDMLRVGYVPTALFAALLLATPIGWGRKWRLLALGLLVMHAFVLARFAVTALHGFNLAAPESLLAKTAKVVSDDYHLGLIVPIVVWLGVTRRDGRYLSFFFPPES